MNGKYILNDLEFDKHIEGMEDRKLLEFTAKLSYSNAIRIMSLENRGKRSMAASGGVGGIIGVAIAVLIDFFMRRG